MGVRTEQDAGEQAGETDQGRHVRHADVLCIHVDVSLVFLFFLLLSAPRQWGSTWEILMLSSQVGLHDLQRMGDGCRDFGRILGILCFWRRDFGYERNAVPLEPLPNDVEHEEMVKTRQVSEYVAHEGWVSFTAFYAIAVSSCPGLSHSNKCMYQVIDTPSTAQHIEASILNALFSFQAMGGPLTSYYLPWPSSPPLLQAPGLACASFPLTFLRPLLSR